MSVFTVAAFITEGVDGNHICVGWLGKNSKIFRQELNEQKDNCCVNKNSETVGEDSVCCSIFKIFRRKFGVNLCLRNCVFFVSVESKPLRCCVIMKL